MYQDLVETENHREQEKGRERERERERERQREKRYTNGIATKAIKFRKRNCDTNGIATWTELRLRPGKFCYCCKNPVT